MDDNVIRAPRVIRGPEDFKKILDVIGQSSQDFRNDRDRPYNGQSHTNLGERGRQLIIGLTMRDVRDCYVMAFLRCLGFSEKVDDGTWCTNDLYSKDLNEASPIAVAQNMTCEIERMMGIYPNISMMSEK